MKPQISIIFLTILFSDCSTSSSKNLNSQNLINSKDEIINWSSPEGIRRFEESDYKVDFFRLANQFEVQSNFLFCGPATASIVLNALRFKNDKINKPQDQSLLSISERRYIPKGFDPLLKRYNQKNIFFKSPKTRMQVLGQPMMVKGKKVNDYGFQLRQFHRMLLSHGLNSKLRIARKDLSNSLIKKEIILNLKTKGDLVLVKIINCLQH
jgi:hypothetical protein